VAAVSTHVTRVVVTQTDEPPTPDEDFAAVPGMTRWVVEWTKNDGRRDTGYRHALYSIDGARRLVGNLLRDRPPETTRDDVLTLVGFEG
jgi:hypothetical protein